MGLKLMFVAVLIANRIYFFAVIVVVGKGARHLRRGKIVPFSYDLLHGHSGPVVVVNHVPYGNPGPFDYRLASANTLYLDYMWVWSGLQFRACLPHGISSAHITAPWLCGCGGTAYFAYFAGSQSFF